MLGLCHRLLTVCVTPAPVVLIFRSPMNVIALKPSRPIRTGAADSTQEEAHSPVSANLHAEKAALSGCADTVIAAGSLDFLRPLVQALSRSWRSARARTYV